MSVRSPISFLSALSREGETELEKKKKNTHSEKVVTAQLKKGQKVKLCLPVLTLSILFYLCSPPMVSQHYLYFALHGHVGGSV